MKYYRCYFLAADNHIARATVLKCADDADAERQCRAVFATTDGYTGAEIWDGARRVCRYPSDPTTLLVESGRRRKGEARRQNAVIEDALSAEIAKERGSKMEADAVKAARLREQRLEREAASKISRDNANQSSGALGEKVAEPETATC
jgi:hypothetical protein